MKQISQLQLALIILLSFHFPLFFLPLTQEPYYTQKAYLLALTVLVGLTVSTISFIHSKKIMFANTPIAKALLAFLIAITVSLIFAPSNKVEALLQPVTGVGVLVFLVLYYHIIVVHQQSKRALHSLYGAAIVLAVINSIFFFKPFGSISLPSSLQFLKLPLFTPIGSQVDLLVFLGFFLVYHLVDSIEVSKKSHDPLDGSNLLRYLCILTLMVGIILSAFNLANTTFSKKALITGSDVRQSTYLLPYGQSWQTAVTTLSNPKNTLLGVGPGGFTNAFTRGKTIEYNQTPYWQITFNQSGSFLLHLLTETGLLGFAAFMLILLLLFYSIIYIQHSTVYLIHALYFLAAFTLLPPSLPLLFVFFTVLAHIDESAKTPPVATIQLHQYIAVLQFAIVALALLAIAAVGYGIGRIYLAEYYFKQSIDNISNNKGDVVYQHQRRAISLNPYIERFRVSFSQLNLLIANNIVRTKKNDLKEADRQLIAQSIQQALAEAKAAVKLDPERASNWENLAFIYRNIIGVAKGAESWAVSAYQRAILLDPTNPLLRLNLGGVYYATGNYADAIKSFQQALLLKPGWANFSYNLAWAYYQNKEHDKAIETMETALQSVPPGSPDYQKAQSDVEQFKKNRAQKGKNPLETVKGAETLSLTESSEASLSPQLDLSRQASPEAK